MIVGRGAVGSGPACDEIISLYEIIMWDHLILPSMEVLQRLTRKQLEVLGRVATLAGPGPGVPLNRLARSLGVSSPTALAHLSALERRGLVRRVRGKTDLSPRGRSTLGEYVRHHRVAEALFARAGLTAPQTCRAAREIDLALGHSTVDLLCRAAGHPVECPHGEPILPCVSDGRTR